MIQAQPEGPTYEPHALGTRLATQDFGVIPDPTITLGVENIEK